jgi:hypothetical protein
LGEVFVAKETFNRFGTKKRQEIAFVFACAKVFRAQRHERHEGAQRIKVSSSFKEVRR